MEATIKPIDALFSLIDPPKTPRQLRKEAIKARVDRGGLHLEAMRFHAFGGGDSPSVAERARGNAAGLGEAYRAEGIADAS